MAVQFMCITTQLNRSVSVILQTKKKNEYIIYSFARIAIKNMLVLFPVHGKFAESRTNI